MGWKLGTICYAVLAFGCLLVLHRSARKISYLKHESTCLIILATGGLILVSLSLVHPPGFNYLVALFLAGFYTAQAFPFMAVASLLIVFCLICLALGPPYLLWRIRSVLAEEPREITAAERKQVENILRKVKRNRTSH